jgi:hypothetical protein
MKYTPAQIENLRKGLRAVNPAMPDEALLERQVQTHIANETHPDELLDYLEASNIEPLPYEREVKKPEPKKPRKSTRKMGRPRKKK